MNARVRLLWIFAVVSVLCVVALPAQAKGEAGSTTRSNPDTIDGSIYSTSSLPACQRSFDVHKVSRSFLKKCGIEIWPLKAVKPLPGGGKAYIYYVGGYKTVYRVPPKSLNTCNATDKQLAEYNLPPRSDGSTSGKGKCYPGPFIITNNMFDPKEGV